MTEPTSFYQFLNTKKDAQQLLNKLAEVSNKLFQIQQSPMTVIDENLTPEEKKNLITYCEQNNIRMTDPLQFQKLVTSLKESLNKIPSLSLELAIKPTEEMINTISSWLQKNFKRKYFLDIQYNPEIMGGVMIVTNGLMKEYSLRKLIESKYGGRDLLSDKNVDIKT